MNFESAKNQDLNLRRWGSGSLGGVRECRKYSFKVFPEE